ncbi:MAG TPA: hypothetical protein VHD32_16845 [Candidatus Didemnitutus sp.]|nr:hypothetical protein [Candidatus Didemnitutus sp.]
MTHHTKEEEIRYRKLDAIDAKCAPLLAVTSILLVFIALPPIFDSIRTVHHLIFKFLVLSLLASCLIALLALFFKERTSDGFVTLRKYALNLAVAITALCCLVVTIVVATTL